MKFYSSSNNGVLAVISEDHAKLYGTVKSAGGDPIVAGCRVFTFCSPERMKSGAAERMTFTGTYGDFGRLMEAGGHELYAYGNPGWDGYVPFSNGYQYGHCLGNEVDGYKTDLRFVTTLADVLDAFGIV